MTKATGSGEGAHAHARVFSTSICEQARAKVNLTLHVKGKRADGYHELESLVVFADFGDRLTFIPGSSNGLSVDGPFAAALAGENLVSKARRSVTKWLGRDVAGAFHLEKHIPVAAGLGGGSSDAAAAIRALFRSQGVVFEPARLAPDASAIGADVPVCLYQCAAWMRGLGERVDPVASVVPLPAVLVNPGVKLATAAVFERLRAPPLVVAQEESGGEPFSTAWRNAEQAAVLLRQGRNDLEAPAIALEPLVADVLEALRQLDGCLLARLSGSGPTCFGLFANADATSDAASRLRISHPAWWIAATAFS